MNASNRVNGSRGSKTEGHEKKAPVVERKLLRIPEVAEALGISRGEAFKLHYTGQLRTVRIGRCVRVPVVELDRYMERLLATMSTPETRA